MDNIIGRENEKFKLSSLLKSDKSEFLAIYGRRRTGKTFLVKEYFSKHICFHMTGIQEGSMKDQLQLFSNELNIRRKEYIPSPKDWVEAFLLLREYIDSIKSNKSKKVIFLDELPWIYTQRSGFLQALGHFWNNWAAWQKNIILIICGSSTSWIIQKIFKDKGGLYNRVTSRIKLEPFHLADTEKFLLSKQIHLDRYQITNLYMVTGGIPFYLESIKKGLSAAQNIQSLCFDKNGILADEFQNLYHALFNNAEAHISIISSLAKNNYGLTRNEILKATGLPNAGSTTRIINDLLESDFIKYIIPYGSERYGGRYILLDFYSRFYFQFIKRKKKNDWMNIIGTPIWYSWAGISFESICYYHIQQIKKALGISGVTTNTYGLNMVNEENKSQIDLLIDRKDQSIQLCEIKFSEMEYVLNKKTTENIRKKISTLKSMMKKSKTVFPTMITTYGCNKNQYYLGLITHEVILDDLFS